jgi:hypothetical protein
MGSFPTPRTEAIRRGKMTPERIPENVKIPVMMVCDNRTLHVCKRKTQSVEHRY